MSAGAVLGLISGPFISAALYALHRAGRALTHTTRTHLRRSTR